MSQSHPPGSAEGRKQAEAAARETEELARAVKEETRETARAVADSQRRVAAGRLHGLSAGLRDSARSLEIHEEGRYAAPWVERAAEGLDRVAATLEQEDAQGLVARSEDFARRNPAVFLGGAAAAGFALARFLRSSSARRRWERLETEPTSGQAPATSQHGSAQPAAPLPASHPQPSTRGRIT
jgi:hypothetical protein